MPWGRPTEEIDGHDVCVFCDFVDPDASHCSQHKDEFCSNQPLEDRTFRSKEAFQQHLSEDHNQSAMTSFMESWSWPPEDKAWYWNCGFCDMMLTSWTNRVDHIGGHFKEGTTMLSWDPHLPPHPLDKNTLACASWFPPLSWDAKRLLDLGLEQYRQTGR
jgi:hypothetical protein